MDRKSARMDKIGRNDAAHLLSQQVTAARYFFLKLAPRREEPLVLVMGGRERCNPDYVISRRRFPYYVIEFVVAGRGTLELDHARHHLHAGMVFATAPTTRWEVHNDPADPMEKYFLACTGTAVPKRLARCGVAPGGGRQLAAYAEVTSVLEDLVREGQR